MLNTVGVPASWKKWLPDANTEGVIEILMSRKSDETGWIGNSGLRYSPDLGLEKLEL